MKEELTDGLFSEKKTRTDFVGMKKASNVQWSERQQFESVIFLDQMIVEKGVDSRNEEMEGLEFLFVQSFHLLPSTTPFSTIIWRNQQFKTLSPHPLHSGSFPHPNKVCVRFLYYLQTCTMSFTSRCVSSSDFLMMKMRMTADAFDCPSIIADAYQSGMAEEFSNLEREER